MDVIVGIDVSMDRLDVHVLPAGESFFVGKDHAGVDELITRLREAKADIVALEATGGYEMLAAAGLSSAGLAVVVVNPAQVRSYANTLSPDRADDHGGGEPGTDGTGQGDAGEHQALACGPPARVGKPG